MTLEGGSVFWGIRVVIPERLRSQVLAELHHGHPGVVNMKAVARSHLWWPGVDKAIESCVRACAACQVSRNLPAKAPLHPWAWPESPWERIHVDFAGPIQGRMLLVVTDAHSKWPEVIVPQLPRPSQFCANCLLVSGFPSKWCLTMAPSSYRKSLLCLCPRMG